MGRHLNGGTTGLSAQHQAHVEDVAELTRRGFDCLHILIRQAEVVADFVDEHMGDDHAESFLMLSPIVEKGPAVENHHIGHAARLGHRRILSQAYALEQAENVERRFGLEIVQYIVRREILDAEDDLAAQVTELGREPIEGNRGKPFKIA